MDYQKTQSLEGQPTDPSQITPEQGVYSVAPETAPSQSPIPAEQNLRSVGNLVSKTTMVPETPQFDTPETLGIPEIPQTPETTPDNLGQITDPIEGLPITYAEAPNPIEIPSNPTEQHKHQHTYKHENIRITNDHLAEATIAELSNLEEKLNQDHNMASFYDDVRDAMESNLENSYNRKLGA